MQDSGGRFGLRALRNASVYTLGNVAQRAVPFLLIPVFTRLLGPEEYGLLALVSLVVPIVQPLSCLALPSAAFWACTSATLHRPLGATLSTITLLIVGSSLVFVGVVWVAGASMTRFWVDPDTFAAVLLPAALAACCANLPSLAIVIHQGLEEVKPYLYSVSLQAVCVPLACLGAVVWVRPDAAAYARGMLAGQALLTAIYLVYFLRRFRFQFDFGAAKLAIGFSLPLILHVVNHWVLTFLDRAMLEGLGTPRDEIGRYMLGYQVASVAQILAYSLAVAVAPRFTRMATAGAADSLVRLGHIAGAQLLGYAVVVVGAMLSGGEVIRVIAPASFAPAVDYVPWIVLGLAFWAGYLSAGYSLHAMRRTGFLTVASLAASASNAALNWAWIPSFGAMGAAYATAVSYVVLLVVAHAAARRVLPIRYEVRPIAAAGVALAVTFATTVVVESWPLSSRILAKSLAGILAFGVLGVAIRPRFMALLQARSETTAGGP